MQIPEGYLEGEIRDGFYVESMMKKTWAAQMEVLAEVDRVCKKIISSILQTGEHCLEQ